MCVFPSTNNEATEAEGTDTQAEGAKLTTAVATTSTTTATLAQELETQAVQVQRLSEKELELYGTLNALETSREKERAAEPNDKAEEQAAVAEAMDAEGEDEEGEPASKGDKVLAPFE